MNSPSCTKNIERCGNPNFEQKFRRAKPRKTPSQIHRSILEAATVHQIEQLVAKFNEMAKTIEEQEEKICELTRDIRFLERF